MANIAALEQKLAEAREAARLHQAKVDAGEILRLPNGAEVSLYTAKDAPAGSAPKTLRVVTGGGTEYVPLRGIRDVNGRNAMARHYRDVADAIEGDATVRLLGGTVAPVTKVDVTKLTQAEREALLAALIG